MKYYIKHYTINIYYIELSILNWFDKVFFFPELICIDRVPFKMQSPVESPSDDGRRNIFESVCINNVDDGTDDIRAVL